MKDIFVDSPSRGAWSCFFCHQMSWRNAGIHRQKINKSSGFHQFLWVFSYPVHCEQRLRLLTQQRSFLLCVMTQGIPRNQNSIVFSIKSNIYTSEIDTKDTKNGHISYLKGVNPPNFHFASFWGSWNASRQFKKFGDLLQAGSNPNQKSTSWLTPSFAVAVLGFWRLSDIETMILARCSADGLATARFGPLIPPKLRGQKWLLSTVHIYRIPETNSYIAP